MLARIGDFENSYDVRCTSVASSVGSERDNEFAPDIRAFSTIVLDLLLALSSSTQHSHPDLIPTMRARSEGVQSRISDDTSISPSICSCPVAVQDLRAHRTSDNNTMVTPSTASPTLYSSMEMMHLNHLLNQYHDFKLKSSLHSKASSHNRPNKMTTKGSSLQQIDKRITLAANGGHSQRLETSAPLARQKSTSPRALDGYALEKLGATNYATIFEDDEAPQLQAKSNYLDQYAVATNQSLPNSNNQQAELAVVHSAQTQTLKNKQIIDLPNRNNPIESTTYLTIEATSSHMSKPMEILPSHNKISGEIVAPNKNPSLQLKTQDKGNKTTVKQHVNKSDKVVARFDGQQSNEPMTRSTVI